MKENNVLKIAPIMLTFFVMGFVDLVGIATNYVKADFDLTDTMANLFPSMVFFWFLVCSVPTGMLMNKIGQKKTVLISVGITILALTIPMISYSFVSMLLCFSLFGIGNALMQVSLNPLLSNLVDNKRLASSLTLGQFVKAIASFSAPIIAGWAAFTLGDWKYLFPAFMIIAVLAIITLGITQIPEEEKKDKVSTFGECFALLGDKLILLSFVGIICHVGIDVGVNVTAPKLLMERLGMGLSDAGYATSVYFLFRTIGCLSGAIIMTWLSPKSFFAGSVAMLVIGVGGLFFVQSMELIYICVAIIGLGNANLFPIILSQAMSYLPEKKNEVSGLMIMGLFGGTIFPVLMGVASDTLRTQTGALIILSIGILYLIFLSFRIKR